MYVHTHTHSLRYYLYLKYPGIWRANSATQVSDSNALDRSMMKAAKAPTPAPATGAAAEGHHVTTATALLKIRQWSPPPPSMGFSYILTTFFKS